jgi:amino acid adenylation domain-containing protein
MIGDGGEMGEELIQGFRLSPEQKHLWLLQEAHSDRAYRAYCSVAIEGSVDAGTLKAALEDVVGRNEILRTTFQRLLGMTLPIQVISDNIAPAFSEYDLTDCQSQKEAIEEVINNTIRLPFDFEQGPLLRAALFSFSPRRSLLALGLPALYLDAKGTEKLVQQIALCYEARSRGEQLNERVIRFVDFSEWLNDLLEAEESEVAREFWREKKIDDLFTIKLPFERESSVKQSFDPRCLTVSLDDGLTAELNRLAVRHGIPTSILLQACWQILLWRFSGQSDFVLGVYCNSRTYDEMEEALGPFAKYLPVESHLEGSYSFLEFLEQVRRSMYDALKWHECFTWEQALVSEEHEKPLSAPFQFEYETLSREHRTTALTFRISDWHACVDRFKIKVSFVQDRYSLTAAFHYDPEILSAPDVETISESLVALLRSIVGSPEADLSDLEILSDGSRKLMLESFNNTKVDYPTDKFIHQLIEEQAARTPDNTAVIFEGEQLSYRELNARANQLARYLKKLGVGPEVIVALCVDRSLEMVVGLLGILKAGGAYLPLDPAYPPERLTYMLEDSRAAVLLTQHRLVSLFPSYKAFVINLDSDWPSIPVESDEGLEVELSGDNTAYVLYTSGSTGQPKGVMVLHGALLNHMLWMQSAFPLSQTDRVLQKTPFSFDASVWEFYAPLMVGTCLVMARPGGHQDSSYLADVVAQQEISIIQLVPSLLRILLDEPALERCRGLKRVFCGGEILTGDLQESFQSRLASTLINLYGPTECTIQTTVWTCRRDDNQRAVPIGYPISNVQNYILGTDMKPVPVGVLGELYIGGVSLARGYLNRPELTAERFVPDPFGVIGGRLYATGDLARYRLDGSIEFVGRSDYQVKFRGIRIELGEVESRLRRHAAVRDAVVMVREDTLGDARLIAYVTLDSKIDVDLLHEFLKANLPDYLLPSFIVELSSFPLTPNGKINRREFPAPDLAGERQRKPFIAPRTPIEQSLSKIWSDFLNIDRVGINESFFDLGGHSLMATRLLSRIREVFNVELPLRDLFNSPTIDNLAMTIVKLQAEQADSRMMAELLTNLEQLSDEEARSLLDE